MQTTIVELAAPRLSFKYTRRLYNTNVSPLLLVVPHGHRPASKLNEDPKLRSWLYLDSPHSPFVFPAIPRFIGRNLRYPPLIHEELERAQLV